LGLKLKLAWLAWLAWLALIFLDQLRRTEMLSKYQFSSPNPLTWQWLTKT
jgi:hypothetical protein